MDTIFNLNGRKRHRRDPVSKLCSQTFISIALKTKEKKIFEMKRDKEFPAVRGTGHRLKSE